MYSSFLTQRQAIQVAGSEERFLQILQSADGKRVLARLATGAMLVRMRRGGQAKEPVYGFAVYSADSEDAIQVTLRALREGKTNLVIPD